MIKKEFQFLVLNTKAGWQKGQAQNLQISDEGLQIKSGYQFMADSTITPDELLSQMEAVDLAVGDFAQIYLLDQQSQYIWLFDALQKQLKRIKFLDALSPYPTQIAYSQETIFLADEQTQTLTAFALINWQIKWSVKFQNAKVVDLVTDVNGYLYALLDAGTSVVAKYNLSGKRLQATGFARGDIEQPSAIAVDSKGFIYVLDVGENNEKVVQYGIDGNLIDNGNDNGSLINFPELRERNLVPEDIQPSGLTVDTQGNLYFGDNRTLYQGEEEDRFIFQFSPSQEALQPVYGYRGAVKKLVADRANRLFIFNVEKKEVDILRYEKQFLRQNCNELPTGQFFSSVFDSTIPGHRWHKLVLEGDIPNNTQIKVSYFATDNEQENVGDIEWSKPLINPQDALIIGVGGRYLYLRVELIGTEFKTPTVKSIRVYLPRLSYLRYLPAVYQEDEISRNFLERFLSLFETFFTNIEGKIDHIARYFDADVVDKDFLSWLSTWLSITIDDNWTEQQLRDLVRTAPQLYKQRGTREGIETTIQILTGDRPLVKEYFQLDPQTKNFPSNDPFRFWVLLNSYQVNNEIELQTIQRLIDANKPAYTEAVVKVLQPWISLDRDTHIGFNSYIHEPSSRLGMGAVISQDTTLRDIEKFAQIGRRSRIGLDTVLN